MATIKKLARVVNTSIEGEPQHAALQIIETNRIFQFSEVKYILEGGSVIQLETRMNDNDLYQPTIQKILNQGHTIEVSYFEPTEGQLSPDQFRYNMDIDLTLHF
jgi:hypothetical protein